MGRVYRETTPAMLDRVTAAIEERLAVALRVAPSNGNNPESAESEQRGQGVDGDLAARAAAVSAGNS
jgi:hypothetical protein